jgi:hypothetical protein
MPAENEKVRWDLAANVRAVLSFAPPGLTVEVLISPTACAVGYVLAALRALIFQLSRRQSKGTILPRRERGAIDRRPTGATPEKLAVE